MKKSNFMFAAFVSVILVAGVAATIVINVGMINKISNVNDQIQTVNSSVEKLDKVVKKAVGQYDDVAKEDGVEIEGGYVIKSTKAISDAYINGDYSKLSEKEKKTMDMANEILSEIVKPGMSDYEKEQAVYDWLCHYTASSSSSIVSLDSDSEMVSTPYGVLKSKSAVCVGFATTFRLMLQMQGIDCKVVHNTSMTHSWNLVKLDGEWYHTDVYTDNGTGNYRNFNMNDTLCASGHEWNRDYFPAAIGTKYSYANLHKVKAKNVYEIPKNAKALFEEKKQSVFVEIKNCTTDDIAIAEEILNKIYSYTNTGVYGDGYFEWSWMETAEDTYLLSMYYNSTNTQESSLSEEIQKKINKALNKAFGDMDWDIMNGAMG